jgi:hypothetical protein
MAIEKIWYDAARREELITLGRRRSRDFSSVRLAQTHLRVFREAGESFSKLRYVWHNWIYQHYHRGLIYFKYRKKLT